MQNWQIYARYNSNTAYQLIMRKYIQVLCLIPILGFLTDYSQAATFTSNGSFGVWSNPASWVVSGSDDDGVPDADDDVIIANSDFVTVTANAELLSLSVGTSNGANLAGVLIEDGVELNILGECRIYSGGALPTPPFTSGIKDIYVGSFSGTGTGSKLIIGGDLIITATNNTFAGIRLIGEAQLELNGSMNLPNNRGFLDAGEDATVTLNSSAPQQIYMAHGTGIKYPNLIVDGNYVTIIGNSGGEIGFVSGDLIVKKGIFNNSGRQIKVSRNIVVDNEASFHLSGGSTISVETGTNLVLDGKLVTEHVDGLGGFKPLGTISFGPDSEIEYYGNTAGQFAGFQWFPTISSCPKLSFSNTLGTAMDKSITVEDITINANGILNGNGSSPEITVTNSWTNNGTFNGQTSTVRLAGNATALLGTGANNFHNLIIDSGVDFSAPQTLTVSGGLTVNPGGSFVHNEGRVVFAQPGASRGTSGVGQFWDVTIVGGVNFDGQDTINHELYLQTGSISSINGTLTLDLNTGYINPEGNGGLNGNLTLIKSASKKGYTAVSLPVGASVSDLKSAGFEYVFRYDDKDAPHYLIPLSDATVLAADGKAYACHSAETNSSNPIIRVSGAYNNTRATVSVPVVSTPVNGQFAAGYTGWNLIGNPFAFDVDWDELLEVSGNTAIYPGVYYQMGDYFQPYIAGVPAGNYNELGPMQGVMVYLPNPGNTPINNTFTFSKEAGLGSSNILRRKVQPTNVLKLNVSNGQYSDATYVRLSSDATVGFDPDMDAYKFRNGGSVPSFFSYKDGVNYSINSVPDMFAKYSMLLAFEPKVAGTYTITLSEEYTYDLPYEIYLEDKVLNVMHPIGIDQSYTFSTNLEERSGRFTLHFENAVITAIEGVNSGFVRVFSKGRDVTLTGADIEEAADVRLYDVAGRMIAEYNKVDLHNKTFSFKVGTTPGVYIVNIVAGEKIRSERVVIY